MSATSPANGQDPLVGNFRSDEILMIKLKIKESTLEESMLTLNYKPQSPESQFYERLKDSFSKNAGFLTKDIADFFKIVTTWRDAFYAKMLKVNLDERLPYVRYAANLPEACLDLSKSIPFMSRYRGTTTKFMKAPFFETQAVLFNYALHALANAQVYEAKSLSDRQIAQKNLMEAIVCLRKTLEYQQGMAANKNNEVFPIMMPNCLRFLMYFANLKLAVIELINGIESKDPEIPNMARKCLAIAGQVAEFAKKYQIDLCSVSKLRELIKYIEYRLALFYINAWANDYSKIGNLLGVYEFLFDGRISQSDASFSNLNYQWALVKRMNDEVYMAPSIPFGLDCGAPSEPENYSEIEEDLVSCPSEMSAMLIGDLYRVYVDFKEVMKLQYNEIFNTISASLGNQKKAISAFQRYTFVLSQSKTDDLKKLLSQMQTKGYFGKDFYTDFEPRIAECEERISKLNAKKLHINFKSIKEAYHKKQTSGHGKKSAALLKSNTAFVNERVTNTTSWQEFAANNLKDLGKNVPRTMLDSMIDNSKKLEAILTGKEKPFKDMLMRVYTDMRNNPGRTEAPSEITTEFFQKLQADEENMIARFESLNHELADYIDYKVKKSDQLNAKTINVNCPTVPWCDRLRDFQMGATDWELFDSKLTKLVSQIEELEVSQVPNTVIHFDTKMEKNPKVKSYPKADESEDAVSANDDDADGPIENASLASLENERKPQQTKVKPPVVIPDIGATYSPAMHHQQQQNQPHAFGNYVNAAQNPISEREEYQFSANVPNMQKQFVPSNADLDSRFNAMSVAGSAGPSYRISNNYGYMSYGVNPQSGPNTAFNYDQRNPDINRQQQYAPQHFPPSQHNTDVSRSHGMPSISPQTNTAAQTNPFGHSPQAYPNHGPVSDNDEKFNYANYQQHQMVSNSGQPMSNNGRKSPADETRPQAENVPYMANMHPHFGGVSKNVEQANATRTNPYGISSYSRPEPDRNQFTPYGTNIYPELPNPIQGQVPNGPQPANQETREEKNLLHSISGSKESLNDNQNANANFAEAYPQYKNHGAATSSAQMVNNMHQNNSQQSNPQLQMQPSQFGQQYGQNYFQSQPYGQSPQQFDQPGRVRSQSGYFDQSNQHGSQFGGIRPQSSYSDQNQHRASQFNQGNPQPGYFQNQFATQDPQQFGQQPHFTQYGQNPAMQHPPYGQNPHQRMQDRT